MFWNLEKIQALLMGSPVAVEYITAQEFMDAVHIRRWKFNQLTDGNKIRTIKKKRKIYVPAGEVKRFFTDPYIQ